MGAAGKLAYAWGKCSWLEPWPKHQDESKRITVILSFERECNPTQYKMHPYSQISYPLHQERRIKGGKDYLSVCPNPSVTPVTSSGIQLVPWNFIERGISIHGNRPYERSAFGRLLLSFSAPVVKTSLLDRVLSETDHSGSHSWSRM